MSHVRTQIRQAAAAALESVAAVETSRVYPLAEAELPILLVYTNGEEIESLDLQTLDRRLELVVDCYARDIGDSLDALLAGVESALNDNELGGLTRPLRPSRIEMIASAEGSAPIGRLRLTYEAHYATSFADPETSL